MKPAAMNLLLQQIDHETSTGMQRLITKSPALHNGRKNAYIQNVSRIKYSHSKAQYCTESVGPDLTL
jgi:hypothetical protein